MACLRFSRNKVLRRRRDDSDFYKITHFVPAWQQDFFGSGASPVPAAARCRRGSGSILPPGRRPSDDGKKDIITARDGMQLNFFPGLHGIANRGQIRSRMCGNRSTSRMDG